MSVTEQWRAIPGYEGSYEVSDQGRVRSVDRLVWNNGAKSRGYHHRRGQILKPKRPADGRLFVILGDRGTQVTKRIHVLVLTAFVGPRPPGLVGCHNDGDLNNNAAGNLRWDTQAENLLDIQRHGNCIARNRTHCPRDHLLVPPNLVAYAARRGCRTCLACARTRADQQRAAKRGEPFDFRPNSDARYADIMGSPA